MKKNSYKISFWKKSSLLMALILMAMVGSDWAEQNGTVGQVMGIGKGLVTVAKAQGLNNNSGSGAQLFCKRDFGNFIVNGLDFDGEGFTDYWRDILVIYNNNYCQFSDIDSLLNRIDKARKQIRQAFYVCDNATTQRATAEYYQLSAELYYLRHFVDTAEATNPNYSEAENAQKVQLRADIRGKFMDKFVKKLNYFNAENGELVFEKIRAKYESKVESYRNCSDPNFEQLWDRVKGLRGTLDTIEQMGKRFESRTKQRFSVMEKRLAENPGLISAFGSRSLGDFVNRVASFRINNEPVQESTVWEQISGTAKENAPFNYDVKKQANPVINFDVIAGDLMTIEARDNGEELDIRYLAEYDLKYRQISGAGLDTLRVNLDNLKNNIVGTFAPMDKVRVCAANVIGKQCGG
jgi:hypothetical protein